jgi:hypothetical protein
MDAVARPVPEGPPAPSAPILAASYPRLRRLGEASLAFGSKYLGVIVSGTATVVLAFVTLSDFFQLPTTPTHRVLAWIALFFVSGLLALASSYPTILQVQRSAAEHGYHRELSKNLAKRLKDAMEEVVQGWAAGLLVGLEVEGSLELDESLEIELHVFVPSDGLYRVIASSTERTSPVRKIELRPAEGLVAMAYEKKNPLIVRLDGDSPGTLWSRKGQKLGPQPPLRDENADRCDSRLQWVYATPIYDIPDGVFETARPLGVLTVDGMDTESGDLYFEPEFQDTIESIAAQLGPYLSALQSLLPAALR